MAEQVPAETTPHPRVLAGKPSARPGGRGSLVPSTLVLGGIGAVLAIAATRGLIAAILACAAAAYLLILVLVGRERTAVLTFMGALATAPMYLGISPTDSTTVTPPDGLLAVGVLVLLPSLVSRRLQLPLTFVAGLSVMTVCGLLATLVATSALVAAIGIVQWLVTMAAFAIVIALWRPSEKVVVLLAWSYVAGHLVSTVGGLAVGHVAGGRWYGLTHHPNAFAESGMMAVALLLYLLHYHRNLGARFLVFAAGVASVVSVIASGGRAATVVVAILIVMVPIVERSAVSGFLLALVAGLFIVVLPAVAGIAGEDTALARLTNIGDVAGADLARGEVQEEGLTMFAEHPLTGSGVINLDLFTIHNTFLQVAVALGVFGVVGFLLVIFPLARPLFEAGRYRRLAYTAWAFVGFAWTTPGMQDRSLWIPMSLAILAAIPPGESPEDVSADRALPDNLQEA